MTNYVQEVKEEQNDPYNKKRMHRRNKTQKFRINYTHFKSKDDNIKNIIRMNNTIVNNNKPKKEVRREINRLNYSSVFSTVDAQPHNDVNRTY